jgi:hypothetical protein
MARAPRKGKGPSWDELPEVDFDKLPPAVAKAMARVAQNLERGNVMIKIRCRGEDGYAAYRSIWEDAVKYAPESDVCGLYTTLIVAASYATKVDPLPRGAGDAAYKFAGLARPPPPLTLPLPRPVHVGYISPDLNHNAVGLFVAPLVAGHDPARCRATVFYTTHRNDPVTCWLRRLSAAHPHVRWVSAGKMSDEELARRLRAERIDVLVDLIGPGHGGRVEVVAKAGIPRVVNYLGFPDKVRLAPYTHRIVDPVSDPRDEPDSAPTRGPGEVLVRLPTRCFVCYSHWEDVWPSPPVAPRPGPPSPLLRLGVLARPLKHHPGMLAIWKRVAEARRDARLLLKDDIADKAQFDDMYAEFPPDAVQYIPAQPRHSAFMDAFNDIDLVLDTYPYSGTTITCAGLYMGLPTLCTHGDAERHVSNVSASIIRHTQAEIDADPDLAIAPLTLESWIVPSLKAYEARLKTLTRQELDAWSAVRHKVAAAFRKAMDQAKFMREFEDAIEQIATEAL